MAKRIKKAAPIPVIASSGNVFADLQLPRPEEELAKAKRRTSKRRSAKAARTRRGQSRTDWKKVDAMSEAALEASIAADPDDVHEVPDWRRAVKGAPGSKKSGTR